MRLGSRAKERDRRPSCRLGTCTLVACLALACAPPTSSAREPVRTAEPDAAGWTIPDMPLAEPRTLLLLQPPAAGPDSSAIRAIAPDPAPVVLADQWVFDLRYDRGDVYLAGVRPLRLAEPRETPRAMGRFALELFSGPTLIERVRFDFPGLGGDERRDAGRISLTSKLTTRIGVVFPATARGSRLEMWDRASGTRWPIPWPPVEARSVDAAPH